jgi:hypothetical protein
VEKTALDFVETAKVAAALKKHLGITAPKQAIRSAGFPKRPKPDRPLKKPIRPPGFMLPYRRPDDERRQLQTAGAGEWITLRLLEANLVSVSGKPWSSAKLAHHRGR